MLKNEKGITLVELLAVLAILSIVIALISSVHLFGQRQYVNQTSEIEMQDEVRYVMSQLTTDVRAVTKDEVVKGEDELSIGDNTYRFSENTVYRNSKTLSSVIKQFNVTITDDGIQILMRSNDSKQGNKTELETTIYFRK